MRFSIKINIYNNTNCFGTKTISHLLLLSLKLKLLLQTGRGTWQNWTYGIKVKDKTKGNDTSYYTNINSTSYVINNLQPNTEYLIQVAAAINNRIHGPWSLGFQGRSLKHTDSSQQPTILWSTSDGLFRSDIMGENVNVLIERNTVKNYSFTDIAWYRHRMFLVSTDSKMFLYNLNSHEYDVIKEIDSVDSLAIDGIGKKLYWSNPKQQLVSINFLFVLLTNP